MKTVEIKLTSGEKITVNVSRRIKYSDLSVIATAICHDVFADGGYFPYMKKLGLTHYMMLYYTDYAFEDADEMMEIDAAGGLADVYKAIDREQLRTLTTLVEDMIDYQRKRSGLDSLCTMMLNEMRTKRPVEAAKE